MREVHPRANQHGAGRHRHALVPEYDEQRHDHAPARRVPRQHNRARLYRLEQEQVRSETVLHAAGERKLRREAILGRKDPSL